MKKTFVLIALLLLLAVPASALDVLSAIPSEMDFVFTFDAVRFFSAPGFDQVRSEIMKDPERAAKIEEFKKITGIDPEKDIHSYVVFLDIPDAEPKKGEKMDPDAAIIVNGRVTEAKILDFIRFKAQEKGFKFEDRFTMETYKGRSVWKGSIKEGRDVAGTVIEGEAVLLGKESLVKRTLDLMGSKAGSLYDNKQMAGLVEPLLGRRAMWLAAAIPDSVKARIGQNPKAGILKSINSLVVSLDFDKELELSVRAITGGAGQAQEIFGMLNGYKALGMMMAGSNPMFMELLGAIAVSTDAADVRIDFRMSFDGLKGILAKAAAGQGGMINLGGPDAVGSMPPSNPDEGAVIDPKPTGKEAQASDGDASGPGNADSTAPVPPQESK